MANNNYFKKFVNGLCLKPIDVGVNPKDETGITTTGAVWVYGNKIKAYLDSAVREIITANQTQTITNKTIDADSNTLINLEHGTEVDNPSSGVHGAVGDIVGNSDAQTLTNKTIDADSNTISNLEHGNEVDNPSSGVHGVTGDLVGDSDTQTLTNKLIDVDNNTVSNIETDNLKSTAKTGSDTKVVTGTKGTADNFAKWNADGDLVDGGSALPSGDIVGTTDTQTLTNKTIDANNNTISNLEHGSEVDNPSSGVHGAVGTIVGTSDAQTLTNKTIDSDSNTISNLEHGAEVDNPSSGVHGAVGTIVGTSDSQTLTNKTLTSPILNSPSISTPSKSDVKQDTAANLATYASTASNGQLCFATDTKKMYQVVDSALAEVGGAGAGDADTIHLLQADDLELSDIDLSGNNSDFDGGGTITASSLTLSTTAADLLTGATQVIKYDPNADGSDDYFGFSKAISIGQRGRELAFQFNYKNDSTVVDDDFRFCVKIKDGTYAGDINYYNLEAFNNSDNTGTIYSGASYIPKDCTEVEFGWQNTSTTTTVEMFVDNILISQSPYIYKDLVNMTDAESYTPTFTNVTISSVDARWRRVGAFAYIDFNFVVTSASSSEARMTLPSGLVSASTLPTLSIVGHGGGKQNVATQYSVLAEPSKSYLTFGVSDGGNNLLTKKDGAGIYNAYEYSYQAVVQIEGWTAESEHVVTPRTGQTKYFDGTDFTMTASVAGSFSDSWAIPYKTQDGSWTLKFFYKFTASTSTSSIYMYMSGIETIASSQPITVSTNGTSGNDWYYGYALASEDEFRVKSGGNYSTYIVYGEIALASKPTWADDVTTNYLAVTPTPLTCYIKDVKATTTAGGTFTSGAWQTRTLNTLSGDTSFVSLSSNQFTLDKGKYRFESYAPGYSVGAHQSRLYNVTDTSTEVYGDSSNADSAATNNTKSIIMEEIELTSSKIFRIEHRCSTTQSANGYGNSNSFGGDEIYTQVKITKVS